ncbi:hypothetical protein Ddye_031348, partial [Dipteronia dyeriana]
SLKTNVMENPAQNPSPMASQTHVQDQSQNQSVVVTTKEFSAVSKCMNFNLPIKLGKINHIYRKEQNIGDALLVAGEEIKERDLVSLVNGVGHELDAIVAFIRTQKVYFSGRCSVHVNDA